ncbi:MAG: PAS domain S-box protein [Nitrospinota bacterium]|nr:PAS domain S-box protein [Nitrospinota bacterium]
MAIDKELAIYKNILENMSDGVITISLEGLLVVFNKAARQILGVDVDVSSGELSFDEVFGPHESEENEAFFDSIIKATFSINTVNNRLLDFHNAETKKTARLSMATSFLQNQEADGAQETIGVIAVFRDVTELNELRDSLSALREIEKLNDELGKRNQFIRQAFGKYMSDEVVDKLLESPEGMEMGGEVKKVTVVMTDIRGFTALSERTAAEVVLDMLNRYFEAMTDVIFKHNGTINKFIGDAIMILFGAPNEREDDAIRAVGCSLEMQLAMRGVNEENRRRGLPELEMGIGINTDKVVAGNMGSTRRSEYGVIGSGVNMASRIESLTIGGQILVSSSTLAELGSEVVLGASFDAPFKGFEEMVQVHEIMGMGDPFNLSIPVVEEALISMPEPAPILYSPLEGKISSGGMKPGLITMVSNRSAVVVFQQEMENLANLKFEIEVIGKSGSVNRSFYGKIMKKYEDGEDGFVVRFTAIADDIKKSLMAMALDQLPGSDKQSLDRE